ncbi:ParB N-terminal domain-containing protein [Novosphingobium aquimarinum]|uniref:ParB N-terminal domain-containing protein n=1 Tax=Novosphingobium aquimarinum TaxID=2682494 RepID=UPI0012EB873B|nr:ParB N-terminal domain-containing protein [Novosphingobium aquimarinum]
MPSQIEMRATTSLKAYSKNARSHSKKQLGKLKKSIQEFGWTNPLIIDEAGMVLCGHGRLAAAIELGMTEVPTVKIDHMTEEQKRAYILADNQLALESSWSKSLLRDELKGLADFGFDLELTGFDTIEIDRAISFGDPEPKADDDVHLPCEKAKPVCRIGDLWQVGKHRLTVGDARDPVAYERLLDGKRAQLILTDPPYGCAIAGNVSGLGKVKHEDFVMGAGETSLPEFAATILRPAFKQMALHASSGAIAFVCTDWRAAPHLLDAAQGVFDELKNLIVWAKTNAGMGTFYRSAHEL